VGTGLQVFLPIKVLTVYSKENTKIRLWW